MSNDHNRTIEQLERRREDSARAMWLAPVLTMAAQAFLLQVLGSESIGQTPRAVVLAAGLLSTLAALWSLLRARAREVLFSEAIASYSCRAGLPKVRPSDLQDFLPKEEVRGWRRLDQSLVHWANSDCLPMAHLVWATALIAFIVADVATYAAA